MKEFAFWEQLVVENNIIEKIPDCVVMDELLKAHCQERNVNFSDAKNMKEAIEIEWNNHRVKGEQKFYYLMIVE